LWDISKFCADAGTMFTSTVITAFLYDFVSKKLSAAYQNETVSWFVMHQTKLKAILADLKRQVISYDLYSELLSSEMYQVKKEIHLDAFVSDICQNLSEYKNNGATKALDYYTFLIKEIEKKYKDEFNSLEELQDYITPILSLQKRTLSNSAKADLFNRDNQMRIDIACLCDLFIKEFTHLLAFIQIHKHQYQGQIADLIDTSNQFLDHIEFMLNMPKNDLDDLSKQNRGLFTVVYEYQKIFEQQVQFLDQYCNVLSFK
jgi:hypothetical protein